MFATREALHNVSSCNFEPFLNQNFKNFVEQSRLKGPKDGPKVRSKEDDIEPNLSAISIKVYNRERKLLCSGSFTFTLHDRPLSKTYSLEDLS